MLEEVKRELEPSEEVKKQVEEVTDELIQRIEEEGYEAKAVGSTSRGTYLEDHLDIDIFFYFPEETPREELEERGVKIGKKVLKGYKPRTHYAEHPYVKGETQGIEIDVVPCYKVEGKPKSAVDRSPLHDEYLKKKLTEEDKREVRALKKFLRNIDCYGAKEKIRGFSGLLCELLILRYGSFKEALEKASNWERGEYIDIEQHGEKNFNHPLVVIDPVDPDRNAAAAVKEENIGRFMIKARELIQKPSRRKFKDSKEVEKRIIDDKNLLLITLTVPKDTVSEILWSQLRRLEKNLDRTLEENGFRVYRSVHWTDEEKKAKVLIDLENMKLPPYEKHQGPPFYNKEHSKRFRSKNKKIFIQENRLYAWRERKNTEAEEVIEDFFQKGEEVPSRFKEERKNIVKDKKKIKKHKDILKKYLKV